MEADDRAINNAVFGLGVCVSVCMSVCLFDSRGVCCCECVCGGGGRGREGGGGGGGFRVKALMFGLVNRTVLSVWVLTVYRGGRRKGVRGDKVRQKNGAIEE